MSARIDFIVGLGNPGPEYEATRHNAGFWFVDELARVQGGSFRAESKFHGDACKVQVHGRDIWLLKPQTFMNRSGEAVAKLATFYKIPLENILVAHDELDIPPGNVRLKQGGGPGGHNGLRDMISRLGGNGFMRLRLGIGHPGDARLVTNYVLHKPSAEDRKLIEESIADALEVLPWIIDGEMGRAMNRLHAKKD